MKRILLVAMCFLLAFFSACELSPAAIQNTPSPAAATPAPTPSPSPATEPTAAPSPTPTPAPPPTKVTVMAVGDLMCLGAQLNAARKGGKYQFDYAFAEVKDILSSADLAIGNLETLIAEGHPYTKVGSKSDDAPPPAPAPPAGIGFNAFGAAAGILLEYRDAAQNKPQLGGPRINGPITYLSAVIGAGFDVLANANNHIYDYKADGIKKTLAHLDEYGITHTGAYAAKEDKKPLVVDVQGIKIGVVSYTDVLNRSPGKNGFMIDRYNADKIAADIAATKEAGAEFTVVYMHWGNENTHKVTSRQKKIAKHIAVSGADLILGSHPHCTQTIALIETQRGNVPVVYSLGNFVSSMAGRTINRDGVIFKFVINKDNVTGEVALGAMSYIATYCTKTSGGSFAVRPADAASAADSSSLKKSRNRTIDVLGEDIATPE